MRKPSGKQTAASRTARPNKLDRRGEILDAAFQVFAAHGYEAARIEEVARRAGIAKGTIYLYFRDKERLFQAVVRNLLPKRPAALMADLQGRSADVLRALVAQMYTNLVSNPKVPFIFRMLVAESNRFPEISEIYHREIVAHGITAMQQVLSKGMAAGEFRKAPVAAFPQIIAAPALLAMVWQLLFGRAHALDLDAYMQAHLDFVLGGLRPSLA